MSIKLMRKAITVCLEQMGTGFVISEHGFIGESVPLADVLKRIDRILQRVETMVDFLENLEIFDVVGKYYGKTRRIGHTTLLLQGARSYDRPHLLIAGTEAHKSDLQISTANLKTYVQSLDEFADSGSLMMHHPIAFDNYAVSRIMQHTTAIYTPLRDIKRIIEGEDES